MSVTVNVCTVLPEAAATICTVEVPVGVGEAAGVVGAAGVVVDVDELPPPHPVANHAPANKATEKTRPRLKEKSLRRLRANAASSISGAQKAAAGPIGKSFSGRGLGPRRWALLPAV